MKSAAKLFCILWACLLSACGGYPAATPAKPDAADPPAATAAGELPAPAELLRSGAAVIPGRRMEFGSEYIKQAGLAQYIEEYSIWYWDCVVLHPEQHSGTADARYCLAYCAFQFLLPDYDNAPLIRLSLPYGYGESAVWVALANRNRNTWDWFAVDGEDQVSLATLAPYFMPDGRLLVLVAACGESEVPLEWVVVGGNIPPKSIILNDKESGPAPLTVTFYPLADHMDPDGQLVSFEWDFEGDGVYDADEQDGWELNHTYQQPGVYQLTLRVTDNDGATATSSITVTVTEP